MRIRPEPVTLKAARLFDLAVWLIGAMVLLALPVPRVHGFANHLRTPEVHRSIERYTFAVSSVSDSTERISGQATRPVPYLAVDTRTDTAIHPRGSELISQAAPPRLLLRLKLGPSRSAGPDPHLQT